MRIHPSAHQNSHEMTGKNINKKPSGKTRKSDSTQRTEWLQADCRAPK